MNIENDKVYHDIFTYSDGSQYIDELLTNPMPYGPISISGYNAASAVNYAIKHATDNPEFMGENSDCANFVSKCINAGNIPIDKDGKWYPATVWGNTNTCGTNWMRTGKNDNGGVVPYFRDKGWLKIISTADVKNGAIMFWNDKSHVAIVTYCDGSTIKYSDHSSTKRSDVYHIYNNSMNVTFYEFR